MKTNGLIVRNYQIIVRIYFYGLTKYTGNAIYYFQFSKNKFVSKKFFRVLPFQNNFTEC